MRRRRAQNSLVPGFRCCTFCRGRGCLACEAQAKHQYEQAFPNGPEPLVTITAEYQPDLAAMQEALPAQVWQGKRRALISGKEAGRAGNESAARAVFEREEFSATIKSMKKGTNVEAAAERMRVLDATR